MYILIFRNILELGKEAAHWENLGLDIPMHAYHVSLDFLISHREQYGPTERPELYDEEMYFN